MYIKTITLLLLCFISAPTLAEKPEWAGKGKPEAQQKEARKDLKDKFEMGDTKEKNDSSSDLKGLEKQKLKKAEQSQKELDKGSEKGQAARAEKSKKWWKFWGE